MNEEAADRRQTHSISASGVTQEGLCNVEDDECDR